MEIKEIIEVLKRDFPPPGPREKYIGITTEDLAEQMRIHTGYAITPLELADLLKEGGYTTRAVEKEGKVLFHWLLRKSSA